MGIRTTNLERSFVIDELIGNITEDGVEKTARLPIEALANQLSGTGSFIFGNMVYVPTEADLAASTPPSETAGGVVLNDPDPTANGYYTQDDSGGWDWQRGLPDTLAVLTGIGGTANAITASAATGVDPSTVQMIILPAPTATNTAAGVTISINGGPPAAIKAASGASLVAGDIIEGVGTFFFRLGAEWRQVISSRPGATFDHQGPYNNVINYTEGQVVTGSDGNWYQLKALTAVGDDPVSGGSGDWLLILLGAAIAAGSITDVELSNTLKARLLGVAVDRVALAAMDGNSYFVVGLAESGRKGTFQWDGSDLSAMVALDTQQGIYVPPASDPTGAGGAWVRSYDRLPTVRVFGAKLDGSTVDSAAIQGALDVLGVAIIPHTSTGFVAAGIDINPAAGHILKTERRPVWKLPAGATHAIRVLPAAVAQSYAHIDEFEFDGALAANTAGAILINTSAGIVSGLRVKGLVAKDCGFAYKEEDSASNFVVDMQFGDVLCIYPRGRQIYSRRSRGFFSWSDIKVDNTYNAPGGRPSVTWNSVYFGDVLGLDFNNLDVVGEVPGAPNNPTYKAGAIGVIIDGVLSSGRGSIYGRRLLVDNTAGPGIQIFNLFNVQIDIVQAFGNLGVGIELNNVDNSTVGKLKSYGGKGITNAAASAAGLTMIGCDLTTIVVAELENNTGSGSAMVGCNDCAILGGYSVNNTGYGYFDDSTGNRNRRIGVQAKGNTAGSLFQDKASHATWNWYPNSGTPTAATVGVASA